MSTGRDFVEPWSYPQSDNNFPSKIPNPWYYNADPKKSLEKSKIDVSRNLKKKSHWRQEGVIFCQNTSIRGIPHILKARNKTIRIMWICFVITLIVGWCTCMIFLLKQYLEYSVIHPPQVIRDANSPFPSVTICNLRPISPQGEQIMILKKLKTPRKYAQDSNRFGIEYLINRKNLKDYITYTGTMNLAAYLESLPSNISMKSLGYNLKNFVIKCQLSYLSGSKRTAVPCEEGRTGGTWRNFYHAQYLNCYTFDITPDLENNATTLEIFLYLDENINSSTCIDCFQSEIKSQLSGAIVAVHTPGTYPNVNDKSINVSPGSLTEITLQTILNNQKTPPYGKCSHDTPQFLYLYGYNYTYSEFACRQKTIQKDINKSCGCRAIEYPLQSEDIPFCSSLPAFIPKGLCDHVYNSSIKCKREMIAAIEKVKCKTSVTSKYNKDVVDTCSFPCSFFSYETDRSISTWPTKLWQIEWLKSKVAKSFHLLKRTEFKPYRKIIELQNLNKHKEALDLLYQTNVLERNLLALLINRPNFNLHKVEEKEVLSLTSFLSQSGGLFSIWLGLTMISLVEVIEMFVNFCGIGNNKSQKEILSPSIDDLEYKETLTVNCKI